MGQELFAVPLAGSLGFFGILTLIVHGIVSLASRASTFKRYTAKQMLIALMVMLSSALGAGGRVVVRAAGGVLRWWLLFTVVFTSFSFLYVTYTEYPGIWLGAVRFYNGNVGPLLHQLVIVPLQITDVLLRGLLPLWDAVWWFIKTLGAQGLLPILVEQAKLLLQMATALLGLVQHLSNSLLAFMESFACSGEACLHPEKGVIDLLSPMGDVREFVALGVQLLREFCSTLAAPLDLIVFPLLDLNLAEGVHHLVNAAVQLVVVIPRATVVRCGLAHGNQFDTLMCTPDMAPFFNFLVAGVSSLGQAVDNWANVAFLIVESAVDGVTGLGGGAPQCDSAAIGMMPDLVASTTEGGGFFAAGGAPAVVVGLTDWLYAVTDGVTAVYMGHNDPGQAKTQAWPHPGMDVSMGVAAVTHSSVHSLDVSAFSSGKTSGAMQTTAMLACNCTDDALLGLRILCSILPMAGVPTESALEDYLLQALFPDTEGAKLYVCSGVDVYVKSVRWSFTRYASQDATLGSAGSTTTLPMADCITRGTCRELDATVWVVPRCGQEANQNAEKGCIPDAPCFPFCMAARASGSGRDNLMLAKAGRWREGLTILGQDCALATSSPGVVGSNMGRQGTVSWTGIAKTGVPLSASGMFATTYANQACTRAPRVTSVVDHAPDGSRAAAANVRLGGQPFAITGDTALLEVSVPGGGQGSGVRATETMVGSVQVERLMGNEVDAFSLHAIAQTLPSLPRVLVPMSEAERTDTTRVTVPYSYGTTRIAATNSRNYVFYASNPNLDVFGAYFEYCGGRANGSLARLGILARSSFGPMRVYRVSAYRRCATYSCGADLVRFTTLEGFNEKFDKSCEGTFNVSVVGLEYLNEDNIAVTVQSSHVTEYNTQTLRFAGSRTRRTTYWLNPQTMGVQRTIWQTAVPTSNFAVLCPSLQRLPRIGSFGAELVNAAIFLGKAVLSGVLYTPGMVKVWRAGGACPGVGGAANYHSVLGGCGSGLYSLDDFFDSVDDAGALFWHSLSLMGKLVASTGKMKAVAEPLTRVMDGTSQYGKAMIDIWSAQASILTLTRVPVKEQVTALWASVQPAAEGGTRQQGGGYVSAALGGWSRFSYKAMSTIALDLVKRTLDSTSTEELTAARVFQLIWADLYDLKDEFDTAITGPTRMGCAGLKLIFGTDNPWASLLYHQCVASAELTSDLLMGLGLNMFVLIPMAKCVCKDSRGRDVSTFVKETCAPPLPVALLPTLYTIANEAQAMVYNPFYKDLQCELVLKHVRTEIGVSLDSWFLNQHLALAALGSAVDYATAPFDSKAGKCMDFANDPHVVVIVPQPVDYFQRCAGTSLCKGSKCALEWARFQAALEADQGKKAASTTLTVATESAFFPGTLDASLVLSNAVAVVEVRASDRVCLPRAATSPPDYSLAVAELTGSVVRVGYWCAPLMSSAGVYRNASSGYGPHTLPGTVLSVQFGDDSGAWLAALVETENKGGQRVVLVNRTGQFTTPSFQSRLGPRQVLMRVENLWVVEGGILADLVTRRMVATGSEASGGMGLDSISETVHAFLMPPLGAAVTNTSVSGVWHGVEANLMQFGGGQYWYTRQGVPGHSYLFLPKSSNRGPVPAYRVTIVGAQNGAKTMGVRVTGVADLGLGADLSALGDGGAMASVSQGAAHVFSTSATGWNWLKQTRLDDNGYVSGVYGSANVEMKATIEGNCNDLSCEGCATLGTQRLCLAFSQCALINCVGTPVHQMRPLCGIGGLLRHWGEMGLQSTHGSWTIFTEMLGLSLELNMLTVHEAHLLWPDDSFLCYVCQAKDASAEFFSILTATLNSAMQAGDANVAYMYGGASNVDTNADAALTISSTALNGFMHQVALFPLYMMISARQVMMCQVTGVLALMDEGGFKLSLRAAGGASTSASDLVAGQCLTVGAEVLAGYPGDSQQGVQSTVGSIASNAAQLMLIQQIEPLLHVADASLAYAIGVVHTLGVLVMSQNMARCNPPTFNMGDILQCACGDHRLQIPALRRGGGMEDGALWCTGVLSMVDSNNQPYFVYNKFTYGELQAMSAGLDAYAKCLGTGADGYKCAPPEPQTPSDAEFFSQQGVTVTNVLVKCRDNFAKKQWDPYAFAFYHREYHPLFTGKLSARVSIPEEDPHGIKECMQRRDPAETGSLSQLCLQEFLAHASVRVREEDYWAYERVDDGKPGAQYTDACLVFSGPADQNLTRFADCVDGGADGQCRLAGHAWTPLSENQVPVAAQHRVLSRGLHAEGLVQRLYTEAQRKVLAAVDASLLLQQGGSEHLNIEIFSVEGDVLHQTMDCIFMGPYSRVDYWPIPACVEEGGEDECLVGPYWSRDEGAGGGRGVDPEACPTLPSLPYTCGSPSRKALMRYLVKDVLTAKRGVSQNGSSSSNSVIHETLVTMLEEIRSNWNDTSAYGCSCGDGAFSPACCQGTTLPLLPPRLAKTYIPIDSEKVLKAMADDLGSMYDTALEDIGPWRRYLKEVAPGEEELYAAWGGSQRVQDEARFDPTRPVSSYTSAEEAMTPLMHPAHGTLWMVCHAALKQTFFTLPVSSDGEVVFDAELSAFDGDPLKLQGYVKNFTREAWRHSPLFRHYSPRHIPSESGLCTRPTTASAAAAGEASFSSFTQRGTVLVSGASLPSGIPVFPAQHFSLGEDRTCLCGWPRVEDRCYPPAAGSTSQLVCAVPGVACDGVAPAPLFYNVSYEPIAAAAFSQAWHCPEFELSAHWGYTDADAAEAWLGSNATTLISSSRDLLKNGRSGLRIGNIRRMAAGDTKRSINPGARVIPTEMGRLTTCAPPPPLGQVQALLDELFPAAQAVDESGAGAYCVRYVIEMAREEILWLTNATEEAVLQQERTAVWHRRCGAQLHLLHLCVNLGVFRPPTIEDSSECRHFKLSQSDPLVPRSSAYATTECLVGANGLFYDPCRCIPCVGDGSSVLDLGFVLRTERCKLRFDARTMLDSGTVAIPVGWFDGVHPLPDPASSLLRPEFAREAVEDADAVGNTDENASSWWQAEGYMTTGGDGAGEFCDGVLDWWPEDWDFPVGYHVTVPCDADDTAYRSFAQAFALDEERGTLVYQHDLLRDAALADSHYGVGGLCRRGSFGMPLFEVNGMRYCTSHPTGNGSQEDFTVPRTRSAREAVQWTEMKCMPTSKDLPWPDSERQTQYAGVNKYDASLYSVGSVPNMPSEDATTYPATGDDLSDIGPWQEVGPRGGSWGDTEGYWCQDVELALCKGDQGCPTGYLCRGRVCSGDKTRKCVSDSECGSVQTCGGVCMNAESHDCIKHSDCADPRMMCSGIGRCVLPTLVVQNRLVGTDDAISFKLMAATTAAGGGAQSCGESGRNYSMLGASYWGNTGEDLLRVHGMCSFEDWFKYTEYYGKVKGQGGCSTRTAGGGLELDPHSCSIMDLNKQMTNQSLWWSKGSLRPDILYLRPTNCDRDHERLQGFTQCAPKPGAATLRYSGSGMAARATEYDQFVRLHSLSGTVILADMPESNDTQFGALGLGAGTISKVGDLEAGKGEHYFMPCALVGQCFPSPFTVNGVPKARTFVDLANPMRHTPYDNATVFKCGVYGRYDSGRLGCKLDVEVLPLYRALCMTDATEGIRKCKDIITGGTSRVCENIRESYQPTNLDRTSNMQGLKALFYAFPAFDSMEQYLELMECMLPLHAAIQKQAVREGTSMGLYFPLMFVLKEMPFDWFFQCIVMTGTRLNEATWRSQDCKAYSERNQHLRGSYESISPEGDSLWTYLRYVRGGYTLEGYQRFFEGAVNQTQAVVRQARKTIQHLLYPITRGDESYPICSQNMLWKIGPYGDPSPDRPYVSKEREIISNWFDPQTCRGSWHVRLFTELPPGTTITTENWIEELSTPDLNNTEPQSNVDVTLLDLIQTRMLSNMQVKETEFIVTNDKGGIYFDDGVLAQLDMTTLDIPRDLFPTQSFRQGEIYMGGDETVSKTCAYNSPDDPLFRSGTGPITCVVTPGPQISGRKDSILTCNKEGVSPKLCSQVPIIAKRRGQYNCRYDTAQGSIIPAGCDEGESSACVSDILSILHTKIHGEYAKLNPGTGSPKRLETVSMPWFDPPSLFDTAVWPEFSLRTELDYERNIQPNPELSVMCDITKTDPAKIIKFTECDSPHYQKLKAHVKSHYKAEGAVVIPPGAQLEWPVERAVLARGVILGYARRTRQLNQTYMDALFDDDTVCKGAVTGTQRVCWTKGSLEFASVNPWLMGNFNPFEVCDVDFTDAGEGAKEFVYAQCLADGNPYCSQLLTQPVTGKCSSMNRRLVSFPGVPRSVSGEALGYNLCYHKLEEDSDGCMHDQGLLGGFDGSPTAPLDVENMVTMLSGTEYDGTEKYVVGTSLYEESQWSIPDDFRQGFYAYGRNPLWQNETAPYGHLQVRDDEIGGHRIGVVVSRVLPESDSISMMAIERLPMGVPGTDTGFLDGVAQRASQPTSEWVPGLQDAMIAEDMESIAMHPPRQFDSVLGASCPLQRWMFYSGGYDTFSPEIPAALRAQHMFHGIHQGKMAHPTMVRATRGDYLGTYRSSNGFCACPVIPDIDQVQCRVPSDADKTRACSLAQTIEALKATDEKEVFESYVFPTVDHARRTKRCGMQLDWPEVGGTLRDGSVHQGEWSKASSPTHKQCHVLDRMLPFRYQYRASSEPMQRLGEGNSTTTVNAGVCQTARVVTLKRGALPATATRCLRRSAYTPAGESAEFTCDTAVPNGETPTMPRRRRLGKSEVLQQRSARRRRCNQCSAPPRFESDKGKAIPPESSFGRLYRHSVERMLAKDLQDALPPQHTVPLNASAWRPGEFMRNYMFAPHRLFNDSAAIKPATKAPKKDSDDDSQRWAGQQGWVYCPTASALKTGQGCVGTMSRADWVQRKTTMCPLMVRSYSAAAARGADPMARTPFCNLDSSTDLVCKALEEAKGLVIQANCIAGGGNDCMPSPYVYHPASYIPSNNAWVHDSVQAFYLKIDPAACPASSDSAQKQQALLDFARTYQLTCPANALTLVRQVLVVVRVIVTDVALMAASFMSMGVKLLALLVTGNTDKIKNSVLNDWGYIQAKGAKMLKTVSDLLMDAMLNSGELGLRVKQFLENTCSKVNEALLWFLQVW
jgi:hypothetical protein